MTGWTAWMYKPLVKTRQRTTRLQKPTKRPLCALSIRFCWMRSEPAPRIFTLNPMKNLFGCVFAPTAFCRKRSEERRVGKEGSLRTAAEPELNGEEQGR